MLPFLGTALAATVGGSIIDAISGHSANQASIALANRNDQFNRNAHQIEVQDLLAAGLNPMISYRGSGATNSGGPTAKIEPITKNTGASIASAIAKDQEIKMMQSGTEKNHADANLADANAAKVRTEEGILRQQLTGGKVATDIGATAAQAQERLQAVEESKARIAKMGHEIKAIGANISLQNAEKDLKIALETGAKIDNQIKDANYNAILSMAKSEALIREYEATEKALGAKAAQAAWRVWLAEKGLTITQIENIMSALPNVALIYPMKTFNNTFINPVKK